MYMSTFEETIEQLENAKNKEDFDKALENMQHLSTKYNPNNEKPTCKECLTLDTIFRKVWELTKLEHYTFKYQCQECGLNWISAFSKED